MLHAGHGGELLVVEFLESGQVAGHDVHQIIGIAKQALCQHDLRNFLHRRFKRSNRFVVTLLQRRKHYRQEVEPHFGGVEAGTVSRYGPALLQRPHATMARRKAQIHPLSQFGKRQAAVRLQFSFFFFIDAIQVEDLRIFTVL